MDDINYAKFSDYTYGNKQEIPYGYDIDKELSNRNRTIFHKDGKAVIEFHGTNIKHPADIGTDALLAVGLKKLSSRFKNAEKYTRLTNQKYGKENVVLSGNSLGASLGLYANSKLGNEAYVSAPHIPFKEALQNSITTLSHKLYKKPVNSNATIRYVKSDPISMFVPLYNNAKKILVKEKKGVKNPHSIRHFL